MARFACWHTTTARHQEQNTNDKARDILLRSRRGLAVARCLSQPVHSTLSHLIRLLMEEFPRVPFMLPLPEFP